MSCSPSPPSTPQRTGKVRRSCVLGGEVVPKLYEHGYDDVLGR